MKASRLALVGWLGASLAAGAARAEPAIIVVPAVTCDGAPFEAPPPIERTEADPGGQWWLPLPLEVDGQELFPSLAELALLAPDGESLPVEGELRGSVLTLRVPTGAAPGNVFFLFAGGRTVTGGALRVARAPVEETPLEILDVTLIDAARPTGCRVDGCWTDALTAPRGAEVRVRFQGEGVVDAWLIAAEAVSLGPEGATRNVHLKSEAPAEVELSLGPAFDGPGAFDVVFSVLDVESGLLVEERVFALGELPELPAERPAGLSTCADANGGVYLCACARPGASAPLALLSVVGALGLLLRRRSPR